MDPNNQNVQPGPPTPSSGSDWQKEAIAAVRSGAATPQQPAGPSAAAPVAPVAPGPLDWQKGLQPPSAPKADEPPDMFAALAPAPAPAASPSPPQPPSPVPPADPLIDTKQIVTGGDVDPGASGQVIAPAITPATTEGRKLAKSVKRVLILAVSVAVLIAIAVGAFIMFSRDNPGQ